MTFKFHKIIFTYIMTFEAHMSVIRGLDAMNNGYPPVARLSVNEITRCLSNIGLLRINDKNGSDLQSSTNGICKNTIYIAERISWKCALRRIHYAVSDDIRTIFM